MSIVIPVNDSYRIEKDRYSWAIVQYMPKTKTNKTDKWKQILWFPSIHQAAHHLLSLGVSASEAADVLTLRDTINEASAELCAAIQASGLDKGGVSRNEKI